MSLKAFHIFFVIMSALCSLTFGYWAWMQYRVDHAVQHLLMVIGAVLAAGFLTWYGRWFLRKLKDVSFI